MLILAGQGGQLLKKNPFITFLPFITFSWGLIFITNKKIIDIKQKKRQFIEMGEFFHTRDDSPIYLE